MRQQSAEHRRREESLRATKRDVEVAEAAEDQNDPFDGGSAAWMPEQAWSLEGIAEENLAELERYEDHPFAAVYPRLSDDEYQKLVADIHRWGLRLPITLYQGKVLDGRHRLQSLRDLRERGVVVPPKWTEFHGDQQAAVALIHSLNWHRRHLTPTQKACRGVEVMERLQEDRGTLKRGRPARKCINNDTFSGRAQTAAADILGVASGSIATAAAVKAAAPDVYEQMEEGHLDLWQAKKLVAERKKEEKRQAVVIASACVELPADVQVWHGDFRSVGCQIEDGTVDLVFTDPPYDKDAAALYSDLAAFAARVLRPGGLCMAYSGQAHLPEVYAGMCRHLQYMWTCAVVHSDSPLRFFKWQLFNGYKPVVLFGKPQVERWWEWFADTVSGGMEKEGHDWQQAESEAAHFIEVLCPEGGIIVDPFCGSGTTLAAAKAKGRRCIGIDIEEKNVGYSRGRLAGE